MFSLWARDACAGFAGPGQVCWERPLVSAIVVACGGPDGVSVMCRFVAFHEACPGVAAHALGPAGWVGGTRGATGCPIALAIARRCLFLV